MSETPKILIPAGLTPALQALLTKANPQVAFIATQADGATPAGGYHRESLAPINDIVLSAVAGAVTFIPPPWGFFAGLVVKGLGPTIMAAVTKAPTKERWPISDFEALEESVNLPST